MFIPGQLITVQSVFGSSGEKEATLKIKLRKEIKNEKR
jgi:hypothetical protein